MPGVDIMVLPGVEPAISRFEVSRQTQLSTKPTILNLQKSKYISEIKFCSKLETIYMNTRQHGFLLRTRNRAVCFRVLQDTLNGR